VSKFKNITILYVRKDFTGTFSIVQTLMVRKDSMLIFIYSIEMLLYRRTCAQFKHESIE